MQSGSASELRNIHWAARNGHLEIIQYLVSQGVDINKRNNHGFIPLHCAAENDQLDIVKVLGSVNKILEKPYERTNEI